MKTSIAFALLLTACATDAIDTSVDDYYTDGKADAFHPPRFETFVGKDGKYYFHLRADNGEIVLQSQSYTRRSSAVDSTASVRANGADPAHYELRDAVDGQTYFVLKAGNGQVIGTSEAYVSRYNAQRGLDT